MSEKTIWTFLVNALGNEYGAAGLMGNLYAESGLIANNLQNNYQSNYNSGRLLIVSNYQRCSLH